MAGNPLRYGLPKVDEQKLKQFHEAHFPDQQVPDMFTGADIVEPDPENDSNIAIEEEDDSLGYYEDGMKRNLTDEQVNIFRHSEIRRLLAEKRREAEFAVAEENGACARDDTKVSYRNSRTQERTADEKDGSGKLNAQSHQVKDKSHSGDTPARTSGDFHLD